MIIPTHNRPERLRVALASVRAQTYPRVEVIVVNDGGVGVEAVLAGAGMPERITYLRLPVVHERSAARNAGIRLARGTYVAYLDDDDWYEPEHVATLVAALAGGAHQVAYADAKRVIEQRRGAGYVVVAEDQPYSFAFDPAALLVCNQIPICCVLHRRDCLDATGLFDPALSTHEDWDLLLRLSFRFSFVHVPRVTCAFTWRTDGSSTSSARQDDFLRTLVEVHRRYAGQAARWPGVVAAQQAMVAQRRAQQPRYACSVVLPVSADPARTRTCLERLAAVTPGEWWELVLVDDGSCADAGALLAGLSGDVQVVRLAHPQGTAAARNHCARAARGRYLVFLEEDALPEPGWLSALRDEVERHPEVAIVGSRRCDPDGAIRHAGVAFARDDGRPLSLYAGCPPRVPGAERRRELQAVCGAGLLVRREVLYAVGGFDETLAGDAADVDLCLRVRAQLDRQVVYQPASVLVQVAAPRADGPIVEPAEFARVLARLAGRWWQLVDVDHLTAEDGLVCETGADGPASYRPPATDAERAAWQRVAAAQRAVRAGDGTQVLAAFERREGWPDDPGAQRWAAAVCRDLGIEDATAASPVARPCSPVTAP